MDGGGGRGDPHREAAGCNAGGGGCCLPRPFCWRSCSPAAAAARRSAATRPATATALGAADAVAVRDIRPSADARRSIQRNVCDAFDGFMRRLGQLAEKKVGKAVLAALKTDGFPAEFVDQINWCRKRTIIDADLAESLHRLRLWRNAATHHNNERWSREGPSSADEVSLLVAKIDKALAAL